LVLALKVLLLFAQVRKHVSDLYEDLRDGHNLISLLEVLSGDTLVSFNFLNLFRWTYDQGLSNTDFSDFYNIYLLSSEFCQRRRVLIRC
jgi:hypothetical protein